MQLQNRLPAGTTQITYIASNPMSRNTVSCTLTIIISDEERPIVHNCPSDQEIELHEGENARMIYWTEPQFTDNVEIAHVYKSKVILRFSKKMNFILI